MNILDLKLSRRTMAAITASSIAVAPFAKVFGQGAVQYEASDNIGDLSGDFEADGSSTLGPLTEAAIEDFAAVAPNIRITNGISGTGGGFERFANGETVMSNASRTIKEEEAQLAADNGVAWYQFPMALDGITVVVSAENDFVEDLTVERERVPLGVLRRTPPQRLVRVFDVDDRQPVETEDQVVVVPRAVLVRAAMAQAVHGRIDAGDGVVAGAVGGE